MSNSNANIYTSFSTQINTFALNFLSILRYMLENQMPTLQNYLTIKVLHTSATDNKQVIYTSRNSSNKISESSENIFLCQNISLFFSESIFSRQNMTLFFSESLLPHEKVHSEKSGVILLCEDKVSGTSESIPHSENKVSGTSESIPHSESKVSGNSESISHSENKVSELSHPAPPSPPKGGDVREVACCRGSETITPPNIPPFGGAWGGYFGETWGATSRNLGGLVRNLKNYKY